MRNKTRIWGHTTAALLAAAAASAWAGGPQSHGAIDPAMTEARIHELCHHKVPIRSVRTDLSKVAFTDPNGNYAYE
jgi:hypothetical protein